jgi:hypothetical protein
MSPSEPRSSDGAPSNRTLREVAGLLMAAVGSLILLGLVVISNDPSPAAEHLLFRLGLALTGLISAVAQLLVFGGLAILWAAAKRRR